MVLWGFSGEKASIFEIFGVFFKELGYFVQISHETMTGFTDSPPLPPRERARGSTGQNGVKKQTRNDKAGRQNPPAEMLGAEYRRQSTAERCAIEGRTTKKHGQEYAQERRSLKKSSMSRAHSSAHTPAYTSGAGATRPSRNTS